MTSAANKLRAEGFAERFAEVFAENFPAALAAGRAEEACEMMLELAEGHFGPLDEDAISRARAAYAVQLMACASLRRDPADA